MKYYDDTQPTHTINVLGTQYKVYMDVTPEDDPNIEHCDGYCDKTVKRIVVAGGNDDCELSNFQVYEKTNLRHEIIHAFLFESGLDGNSVWCAPEGYDHPEQVVQWMALQIPKIVKVFEEVKAI